MKDHTFSRILLWITLVFASLILAACGESENKKMDPILYEPSEFLPFLRWAIEVDSLELLQKLCHPDPSRIYSEGTSAFCNIATEESERIEKFKQWFGNCTQEGEITIEKDMAYVRALIAGGELHSVHFLEERGRHLVCCKSVRT